MLGGLLESLMAIVWTLVRIVVIGIVVFAVWHFFTLKKAVKIKEEIDKDPEAYFAKQEEERKKQYREENGIIEANYEVVSNEPVKEEEKVK
ncbi:MAG: hypothetical protein IIY44_02890 [Erysipelotrichales bacterium]|nr:hypothetical protein [Erysipelotrichales bacterium]MBQ1386373.1 hypothetical protein [Erysipelotrichales bacterium]MBQ2310208.1 hypothetical protein [Erysipelotrichales bacterium]MBQ2477964.1 hypothetical protein [Erysipelotrichales bacterium]MBQ4011306.1 hypothetical protein [Erysipelotrichales bacterium]